MRLRVSSRSTGNSADADHVEKRRKEAVSALAPLADGEPSDQDVRDVMELLRAQPRASARSSRSSSPARAASVLSVARGWSRATATEQAARRLDTALAEHLADTF
ncbi:hypothetical protein GCM10020369_08820 [Cryptosporangium minutisporangium]|uniref:Uncharacterized protein n=1 Tax=Cryptosporangium minutisporangium TaxID=113569 RepID=A0ABP6SRQ1_9ACTN